MADRNMSDCQYKNSKILYKWDFTMGIRTFSLLCVHLCEDTSTSIKSAAGWVYTYTLGVSDSWLAEVTDYWSGSCLASESLRHVLNRDGFPHQCLYDCNPPVSSCLSVCVCLCARAHVTHCPHRVIHYSLSRKPISFTSTWEILTFPSMAS